MVGCDWGHRVVGCDWGHRVVGCEVVYMDRVLTGIGERVALGVRERALEDGCMEKRYVEVN